MKTFLSIGTGPGIGYATAERFAKEGFRVILSARNVKKLKSLTEKMKANGYVVEGRIADVTDAENVASLIAAVEQRYNAIDVIHYNAATLRQATIDTQPKNTFMNDLAVDIGGAFAATQAAAPKMIQNGAGTILYTGGGFALQPNPDYLSLSVGKTALRTLALTLFEHYRVHDIHIGTVTVATFVMPESQEAQDISEAFWQLHSQTKENWTAEIIYPAS